MLNVEKVGGRLLYIEKMLESVPKVDKQFLIAHFWNKFWGCVGGVCM